MPLPKTHRTFFILDGHALLHRAYHAPFADLDCPCSDCDGDEGDLTCRHCSGTGREPTKATYLVTRQLLKLLREKQPDFIAMAVDSPREQLERKKLYPLYKANRPDGEWQLKAQIRRTKQIVKALGIPVIQAVGYEADDVIATLVDLAQGLDDVESVVVSRDKDLMQLIGHNCRMYDPMEEVYLDGRHVYAKFGVHPDQVRDYLALVGDGGDNVPGCKGVGPDKAKALLTKFYNLDKVLSLKDNEPYADPKVAKARLLVSVDMENVLLSRILVSLNRDVPLGELSADDLRWKGLKLKKAQPIFHALGFKRWED